MTDMWREAEAYAEHSGDQPPCPSAYCPCPDCRDQHAAEIAAANTVEDEAGDKNTAASQDAA